MIGILDSGLGGLVTLKRIKEMPQFKETAFICLADQKNAPYGEKTKEEMLEITRSNLEWFKSKGVSKVLIACNTICSSVYDEITKMFPELELINIVTLTSEYLFDKKISSIAIIATKLSIETKAYESRVRVMFPDSKIYPVVASKLVPLIEGNANKVVLKEAVSEYLSPLVGKVNSVLLGCTHYPLLSEMINELMDVEIYDSNEAIISYLDKLELDNGTVEIYTSLDCEETSIQISEVLGLNYKVFNK